MIKIKPGDVVGAFQTGDLSMIDFQCDVGNSGAGGEFGKTLLNGAFAGGVERRKIGVRLFEFPQPMVGVSI